MKMNMINNITKTTAITTKQGSNSNSNSNTKIGVDEINVNVGLPKINSKKNHLASIDDDYEEETDERVPQKPKNLRRTPEEEHHH